LPLLQQRSLRPYLYTIGRWIIPAFVVAVILQAVATLANDPTVLIGNVIKVRDGDTIEVGRVPIRLNGVSAPEMNCLAPKFSTIC